MFSGDIMYHHVRIGLESGGLYGLWLLVIIYNINQHYTIGVMIMLCKNNNYTGDDKLPTKYGAASSSISHEGTPVVCLREFHGACPQVSPRLTFVGI